MMCWLCCSQALAQSSISISGEENGLRLDAQYRLFHDESGVLTLADVEAKFAEGAFSSVSRSGSTGFEEGAFWVHFALKNQTSEPTTLHIEYVDHQLIELEAYTRVAPQGSFLQVADLSLNRPFSERPIPHNRFVFEVQLGASEQQGVLVKMASEGKGYVFPNLRVWAPNNLAASLSRETSAMMFLFGGFFVMGALALVAGIATTEKFFYAYSVYSFSKIAAWATIFGYTHRYVLTDNFHWSYMSISGAITIFCGLLFSRLFLQTRQFTPKLDWLLVIMMANALLLFFAGVLQIKSVAVLSITLALLLYPVNFVVGLVRWRQGLAEAGVFALAWSFLMLGLVVQALRDLGFVDHNLFNYYWPPFASYTEVVVIMAAMGLKVRRMRLQKEQAETRYTQYLEQSTADLESQVAQRTAELEAAKKAAEHEARTDALTGTRNRRSFFADSEALFDESKQSDITFSLLMFDIDNFKDINDNYGHQVGDLALKQFARVIGSKIRDGDIFGRLGGEEFSLLLCGDKQNAMLTAERLRRDVAQLSIDTGNGTLGFTTSIGVAHLTNQQLIDDLVHQADRALYLAKQQGRNRVVEGE